jgi:hypothetical protein
MEVMYGALVKLGVRCDLPNLNSNASPSLN